MARPQPACAPPKRRPGQTPRTSARAARLDCAMANQRRGCRPQATFDATTQSTSDRIVAESTRSTRERATKPVQEAPGRPPAPQPNWPSVWRRPMRARPTTAGPTAGSGQPSPAPGAAKAPARAIKPRPDHTRDPVRLAPCALCATCLSRQNRLKTKEPFVPPKPKLFLTATSIFISRAVLAQ